MNIVFYILTAIFFIISAVVSLLFYKSKKENKSLKTKYDDLLSDLTSLKDRLLNNKRIGYYCDHIELQSRADKAANIKGDIYYYTVHVEEIDRYVNGMSKINLLSVEITGGYDHSQYEWVKKTTKDKFSSIKLSADVEWLESVESIKKIRHDKLSEIVKKLKEQ